MNNNGNQIYMIKKIRDDFCVDFFRNLGITWNRNRKVGTGTVKLLPRSITLPIGAIEISTENQRFGLLD